MGVSTSSLNNVTSPAVVALSAIHILGIDCIYGLVYRNGYIAALNELRDQGPYFFTRIEKSHTYSLHWNQAAGPAVDAGGRHVCQHYRWIIASIIFVRVLLCWPTCEHIHTDSHRRPERRKFQRHNGFVRTLAAFHVASYSFKRYSVWYCLMQGLGYGFVMPLWCINHLLRSKAASSYNRDVAKSIRIKDCTSLKTLPMALIVGYIVPTVLMAAPVPWNILHRWLGGLWQGSPIWVFLAQWALKELPDSKSRRSKEVSQTHLLDYAYRFALISTSFSHLITLAIIGAKCAFPWIFSPFVRESITLKRVFMSANFSSPGPMSSMAEGIHNFFQYDQYVGSVAAMVWAFTLQAVIMKEEVSLKNFMLLVIRSVGTGIIAGPSGALVAVLWNRNHVIFADDAQVIHDEKVQDLEIRQERCIGDLKYHD